jgi:hypothetical protein
MAYKVDKFNGAFLVNVNDGTIDTTTDLRFVGKNYAGYGEVQNENFLHLMENFANTTPPPKAVDGQIWYDSANKKLKFYDGNKFKFANGAETADTAPSGLQVGEFWWDTSAQQLYTWSGTDFILVGPEASPDLGASSVQAITVKDDVSPVPNNYSIVQIISAGKVMAIISREAFTLNPTINPIDGFTAIKKGITLVNTNNLGESSDDHYYWGTASDANRLGQRPASDYLLKTDLTFTSSVSFKDPGFLLGDNNDLRIRVENGDEVIVENRLGNEITFRITVAETTDERDVGVFTRSGFRPGLGSVYDLGTSLVKWNNVHAVTFVGNLTGNVTGNLTGIHQGNLVAADSSVMVNATAKQFFGQLGTPSNEALMYGSLIGNCQGTATTANNLREFAPSITLLFEEDGFTLQADQRSVPIRNSSGDITARQFIGTADKADQLLVGTIYRSTSLAQTGNTIAARDSNGDIFARLFQGTATSAQYADLAEKYLADQEYTPGTVVVIGGEAEVTACTWGQRPIGVVSTNPAFMMNKDLEGGTYIALKGRVPCKVVGSVKKGDRLIASNQGCASAAIGHSSDIFAIAMETNLDTEEKIIEVVVL